MSTQQIGLAVDVQPGQRQGHGVAEATETVRRHLQPLSWRQAACPGDLDAVARDLADTVNAVHAAGYDLDGTTGTAFFSYDPADPAATLTVAVTARQVAASSLPGGVLDGSNADVIGTAGSAEAAYQRLVNGFGTEVASAQRLVRTQSLLTTQVDSAREQLSGVNLDEETVAMLTAQRAYEAAARVMSVMDSVLDTLINRTGIG